VRAVAASVRITGRAVGVQRDKPPKLRAAYPIRHNRQPPALVAAVEDNRQGGCEGKQGERIYRTDP